MVRPRYGQVVVGPPGAGKTTFCDGMQQYLKLLGRDACVVNLDPANDENLPYEPLFDVCQDAVHLASVMERLELGPNGGLLYCMEYLESHADEIIHRLEDRLSANSYLILDFPGQVELYTHSTCVQNLLHKLTRQLDLRLTAVQLIDAHYCTDATKFLSAALLGTTTLLRLELPAVSVLSKVDLLLTSSYGELPLQLEFFTECHDLDRLVPFLDNQQQHRSSSGAARQSQVPKNDDDVFAGGREDDDEDLDYADDPEYQRVRRKMVTSTLYRKHQKLHKAIAEVVDDFGLLSFLPLDVSNAESMGRVLAKIDKSNGYVFTEASVNEDLFKCAIKSEDPTSQYEALADVRERTS